MTEYTILIVDDVKLNRAILAETFRKDYAILEAANGQEALDILKSCAGRRKDTMYTVASTAPDAHCAGTAQAIPIPVETGGVTVFVMDLNRLEKF